MRAGIWIALLACASACSVPDFHLVDAGGGSDDAHVDARPDTPDAPQGDVTITNVTSSTANGLYKAGISIQIDVTFSAAVTVNTSGGTPKLALNSGGSASYTAGSGATTLIFTYLVADGQLAADLDYAAIDSLTREGGTIRDSLDKEVNVTLPAPGAAGSLGANKGIAIDAVAPVISAITGPAMYAAMTTGSLSYSISDTNLGNTTCMHTVGTGTTSTCTASSASFTALAQGAHTITITHTDLAGNVGTQTYSWIVDTVAPVVGTVTGPNAYVNSTSATLAYAVTEANPGTTTCTHTTGTGTTSTCTGTSATFTALSTGAHTITITHTDIAGNTSAAKTYSWTIDTTAPVVSTITGPAQYSASASATLSYTVTEANPGSTSCVFTTGTGTISSCTASSAMVSGLNEGLHTLKVTHTDAAGNTSTAQTYSWTVDTIPPVISMIAGPANDWTATNSASITFAITDANPSSTMTCSQASGTGTDDMCTTTMYSLSSLSYGAHVINLAHRDLAGNLSAPTTYQFSSCTPFFFTAPGSQTFSVPGECGTVMEIRAWAGGGAGSANGGLGGGGGFGKGILSGVSLGQNYTVTVGGGGVNGAGGIGGGGNGGMSGSYGGGGGGASSVSLSTTTYLKVGGGGGGGSCSSGAWGGPGGVPIGGYGGGTVGGGGASSSGGGYAGGTGTAGTANQGGTGGPSTCSGGGGGGGLFGGGGGGGVTSGSAGGGGGGNGVFHASLTGTLGQTGAQGNNSTGGTTDPYYVAGVGVGGLVGNRGGDGRVVIHVHP